jgi:hypothetical protein
LMVLPDAMAAKNLALSAGETERFVPIKGIYHLTLLAQYAADILPLAMLDA